MNCIICLLFTGFKITPNGGLLSYLVIVKLTVIVIFHNLNYSKNYHNLFIRYMNSEDGHEKTFAHPTSCNSISRVYYVSSLLKTKD